MLLGVLLIFSSGQSLGQPRDHGGHQSAPGHPPCETCDTYSRHDRSERPLEYGQGIFAAIQEMVMLLEGKPDTDWTAFSVQRLYTHLVDMNEITLNTVVEARSLDDGLEMSLTGGPRALEALARVIPEQADTLGRINRWQSSVRIESDRVVLAVTSQSAEEVKHINGLGFVGLMATGSGHHQPFHLALARGETDGAWPREANMAPVERPSQAHGQHDAGGRPYAGMQERDIKALSVERMSGLLAGRGLGYALAAELNHYPGPRHVLDLADALALGPEQRAQVQALFDAMQAEAIFLGTAIVEAEAALDEAFAGRDIDRQGLEGMVAGIAQLEGRLRTLHLATHLEMQGILTPHQIMLYGRQRGYGADAGPEMNHQAH